MVEGKGSQGWDVSVRHAGIFVSLYSLFQRAQSFCKAGMFPWA